METSRHLSIGLFEEDTSPPLYLAELFSLAGHIVSTHAKQEESLETFLEVMIGQAGSIPYDLVIIDVSPSRLKVDDTVMPRLLYLASLDRFPLILLTDTNHEDFAQIQSHLPTVSYLSRNPLYVVELFRIISTRTGTLPLPPITLLKGIQQIQRKQVRQPQQPEQALIQQRDERSDQRQAWLDQRREWLDQRQEWLDQRQEWLDQRQAWLDHQWQHAYPQREWLDEQQAWIQEQYQEVKQQRIWLRHLRLWLDRYQNRFFNPPDQPLISDAGP